MKLRQLAVKFDRQAEQDISTKMRLIAVLLCVFLSLTGCTSILSGSPLNLGSLTPEQIEAYDKAGAKAFSCLSAKGPPPAGALVIITMPKEGATFAPRFGDNCQVMQ